MNTFTSRRELLACMYEIAERIETFKANGSKEALEEAHEIADGYHDEYEQDADYYNDDDLLRYKSYQGNLERERTEQMTPEICCEYYEVLSCHPEARLRETAELLHDIIQHSYTGFNMTLQSLMYLMRAYVSDMIDYNE